MQLFFVLFNYFHAVKIAYFTFSVFNFEYSMRNLKTVNIYNNCNFEKITYRTAAIVNVKTVQCIFLTKKNFILYLQYWIFKFVLTGILRGAGFTELYQCLE